MTVQTEIEKRYFQLTYFVTIEGIGWAPYGIYGTLADGFEGRVWATGYHTELQTALDTGLTCYAKSGLRVDGSISEKADFRTGSLSISGLSFSIQDDDDWWLQNFTPRKAASDTTIYAASDGVVLEHQTTTIPLTDGTDFVEGDDVWIGGRELVALGTKVNIAGDQYDFTGSTRARLGTRRGSSLRRPQDYSFGVWPNGTSVSKIARWWRDRKVALWAWVPGESISDAMCMWFGKLRSISNPACAGTFKFECAGDFLGELSRKHEPVEWVILSDGVSNLDTILNGVENYDNQIQAFSAANNCRRVIEFLQPNDLRFGKNNTTDGKYGLAAAYHYRWEAGGTPEMISDWDGGSVLALHNSNDAKILRSYALIGDQVIQLLKTNPVTDYAAADNPSVIMAEAISSVGTTAVGIRSDSSGNVWSVVDQFQSFNFAPGTRARFLLDNMANDECNRFFRDGSVMTHPIDILLAFLTSSDREFVDFLCGAGSTTTNVVKTVDPGWTSNAFIGYALFCTGPHSTQYPAYTLPNNKFYARWITDNGSADITVEKGFPNAPNTTYEHYQVRNGVWDVLPIGWGMGVDVRTLDIDAFQHIKVDHLQDAKIGKFILGTQSDLNIWQMLQQNIMGPYGILMYFDRVKRKISAAYVGEPMGDCVIDEYVEIDEGHIQGPGSINDSFSNPIRSVELTVRAVENRVVALRPLSESGQIQAIMGAVPALFGGATTKITINPKEMEASFSDAELDTIKMSAIFNTDTDAQSAVARLSSILSQYVIPPPVWSGPLDIELFTQLHPGSWVLINWNSPEYPTNPLTGQRGWSNVIGRIIEMAVPVNGKLTFDCSIELFQTILGGRIAPATKLVSSGSDGNGDYFNVGADNYNASAPTLKDWWFWEVGDVLEWRDSSGARKAGSLAAGYTITGFGTNFASTPETATGNRIYFDESIVPAVDASDYLTFYPWSDGQDDRKELYSALCDTDLELGAAGDLARRYG